MSVERRMVLTGYESCPVLYAADAVSHTETNKRLDDAGFI